MVVKVAVNDTYSTVLAGPVDGETDVTVVAGEQRLVITHELVDDLLERHEIVQQPRTVEGSDLRPGRATEHIGQGSAAVFQMVELDSLSL